MKVPFIIYTKDSKPIRVYLEEKPIVFGRMGSSHAIDDPECSRRHCMVTFSNNEILMEDLESKNGTQVNGVRTTSCRIFIGDIIRIGNTKITLDEENLTTKQKALFTYKGSNERRISGEITLQLDNNSSSQSNSDMEAINQQKLNKLYNINKKR